MRVSATYRLTVDAIALLMRPYNLIFFLSLAILYLHVSANPDRSQQLVPDNVYQFSLSMIFEPENDDVEVTTFLPQSGNRQELLDEDITAQNMNVEYLEDLGGRIGQWNGGLHSHKIHYRALLSTREIHFELSDDIEIPEGYDDTLQQYLEATDAVPVIHPEIKSLWSDIKPSDAKNTSQVLKAIYKYVHSKIETVPFKGLTDSLTALRLNSASCNGKSRLFVSMARLNNLPARLVGGVIMNKGRKRTSHQWVEVYIDSHWVPFDPTNGYFGMLPANYLELYRGDHVLFRHTPNINFDYRFNATEKKVAPALYRHENTDIRGIPNAATLLQELGLTVTTTSLFLLFPLCTLIITFMRNVVGVKTFGIFMPMLIAAACVFTGFFLGMLGFVAVLVIAYAGHVVLGRYHILKVPRLAAIITLNNIIFLSFIYLVDTGPGIEFGMLSLFPVVILSFVAERLHQMSAEANWKELIQTSLGTVATIVFCYLGFMSVLLQGIFSLYPETYLLVLSALIYIGSWSGVRMSEIIRFRGLLSGINGRVLGINSRNRDFVYRHNSKQNLRIASSKLETKKILSHNQVPVPETMAVCKGYGDLEQFITRMEELNGFVLKPNNGARGNGIVVVTGRNETGYFSASGQHWSAVRMKKHVEEILGGAYSQSGSPDYAYIEKPVRQDPLLETLAPYGLSDIRIIVSNGKLLSAMLRVPTRCSGGKANLHQGAIGVAVDLQTGVTTRCVQSTKEIESHPDSGERLISIQLPHWDEITEMAQRCYRALPLGYLGVDICLDASNGPVVLELNGRPGLEIQNIHNSGIYDAISQSY